MRLSALALALVAGCSADAVLETGLVVRPSGLAHVQWSNDPAAPLDARGDIFIADPEAGGVSIIQLAKFTNVVADKAVVDNRFIYTRAPNLFFPLVLPAPTYPTRVATASVSASRLYALSPVDAKLHVFSIKKGVYASSITIDQTYGTLGAIDLRTVADPMGLAGDVVSRGVVVDLDVLVDGGNGPDTLLLAVDDLALGSRLLTMTVSSTLDAQFTSSATVAASPRTLAIRTSAPAGVLVSAAQSNAITLVAIDADKRLGSVRTIDVGGPTSAVVDAGESGAVALRLDRPALVVLDAVAGALVATSRALISPYSTPVDQPGEVSLRNIAVAGAAGRIAAFPTTKQSLTGLDLFTTADRGSDGLAPAVYVAYADGGGAFLIGRPLRWPTQSIRPLRVAYGAVAGVEITGCPEITPVVCEALSDSQPVAIDPYVCESVAVIDPAIERVRAVFRGAFASDPTAALTRTSTLGPIRASITWSVGARGIADIQNGDRVYVGGALQTVCTASVAPFGEGTVRTSSAGAIEVELDAGRLADIVADCAGPYVVHAEAYGASPELVLDTGPGTAILERIIATSTNGLYNAHASRGIVADLTVVDTATCVADVVPIRACSSDAECPGSTCALAAANVCGGRCAPSGCTATDPGCWRTALERRCPTAEVAIAESALPGAEIGIGFTANGISSLPEDVVFSSVRKAWIISFPGSRSMGSVGLNASGVLVPAPLK